MWWVNVATFRMLSIHTLDIVPTVATLGSWPQTIITLYIIIMSTVTMDRPKNAHMPNVHVLVYIILDITVYTHTHTHTHTQHTTHTHTHTHTHVTPLTVLC